jgi:hypothetical protein
VFSESVLGRYILLPPEPHFFPMFHDLSIVQPWQPWRKSMTLRMKHA